MIAQFAHPNPNSRPSPLGSDSGASSRRDFVGQIALRMADRGRRDRNRI